MKRLLFAIGIALAIIGCGGGGGSRGPGGSPSAATRDSVRQSSLRSFLAAAQSGALSFGGGTTGGTSGGGAGMGFGVPFIGGFVQSFAPVGGRGVHSPLENARLHRLLRARPLEATTTGSTGETSGGSSGSTDGSGTGGTGGGDWQNFYYDEYLGLWVDTLYSDLSYSQKLYLDEAKTQPAGSFETSFPQGWDTFTYEYQSKFEITAGNFAGAHGSYTTTVSSDSSGASNYDNFWPGYGSDQGSWTWSEQGTAWTYEGRSADGGAWYKASGEYFSDGHGSSVFEDSSGYKFQYRYNADGSGSARIEGPDSGLPATLTWTAEGHFRLVWADGTVEEWDAWEMWEGGGGTTGSTTAGEGTTTTGEGTTTSTGSTGGTGGTGKPD